MSGMDKLRAMKIFTAIADAGSLTAAAEGLGMSLPAVVRSLAALERDVGVRLLNRTTRRSALTEEGREYYERALRVLEEVRAVDDLMSTRRSEPRGRLRLTAPVTYGRLHVAPVVMEYLERYPGVVVELVLLDRVIDLVEEGIDAAIRIGALPDSTLVARRIGETRRVVCAAPAYLKAAGTPKVPADLARHRCITFSGLREWQFAGVKRAVAANAAFSTNQVDVALDACLRGLGCAQFLCYQTDEAEKRGRLVRVLREFEPAPVPIQVVYPHARLVSANVSAFVELALERRRAAA